MQTWLKKRRVHTAIFGVFGIIRYKINFNMIAMRVSGPINSFGPYCFGCAVIQIGELNIETENAWLLENVMQLVM